MYLCVLQFIKQKMRKIYNYILTVCFCLLVCACKSDKPSGGLPKSNYDFYTHYRNFIIDKIQMSHVTIKGIPTNGHAIYMLQVYTTGCNPETRMRGKQVEGGHRLTYEDGCADTICRIEFKTKANRIVTPHPLTWNGHIGESCIMSLSDTGGEEGKRAFYEGDIRDLPYDITYPSRLWIYTTRFIEKGNKAKDTLIYLISFHEKRKLPDSVIFVLPRTNIKAQIVDSPQKEYHEIWHSDFMGHSKTTKAELDAKVKEIQIARKRELDLKKTKQ